jgi:hypothetical protein
MFCIASKKSYIAKDAQENEKTAHGMLLIKLQYTEGLDKKQAL